MTESPSLGVSGLLASQEVMTRTGATPAADLCVGDEVLTHRGRFRPVSSAKVTHFSGPLFGVKLGSRYNRVTWLPPHQEVLIRDRTGSHSWALVSEVAAGRPGTGSRQRADYWNSWVALPRVASDSAPAHVVRTADHVSWQPIEGTSDRYVRLSPRKGQGPTRHYATLRHQVDLDRDFGWLLGMFLSEGQIDRGSAVLWHLHEDESAFADRISAVVSTLVGKAPRVYRPNRDAYRGIVVAVQSTLLAELMRSLCGSGAAHKRAPGFVFDAPERFQKGVLQGVLDGDGSKTRPDVISLEQTSASLHWQMRTLAARLRGDFASTYLQPPRGKNHAQSYRANFSPDAPQQFRHTLATAGFVFKPVCALLSEQHDGPLFQIAVDGDGSLVSDFALGAER